MLPIRTFFICTEQSVQNFIQQGSKVESFKFISKRNNENGQVTVHFEVDINAIEHIFGIIRFVSIEEAISVLDKT